MLSNKELEILTQEAAEIATGVPVWDVSDYDGSSGAASLVRAQYGAVILEHLIARELEKQSQPQTPQSYVDSLIPSEGFEADCC